MNIISNYNCRIETIILSQDSISDRSVNQLYGLSCTYLKTTLWVACSLLLVFLPLALQPNSGLGRLHETFRFTSVTRSRIVGRTPWTGDQLVARPLPIHKHRKTHTQHKHYTSLPWVWFEHTVPASARAKTVHALDSSATVTGNWENTSAKYYYEKLNFNSTQFFIFSRAYSNI
jgi:hypothetical protein